MDTLVVHIAIGLGTGLALGILYFWGLWWTVRRAIGTDQKGLWLAGSYLLRLCLVGGTFFLVCNTHWERWLTALLGFLIARAITVARFRQPGESANMFKGV